MPPEFTVIPIRECGEPLLDLSHSGCTLSPEYHRQGLTDESRMFLRKSVVDKLHAIERAWNGARFKIWDGWRPRNLQRIIYEALWARRAREHPEWSADALAVEVGKFVNPGSDDVVPPHSTGGTIDLTVVGADGAELAMGTQFDHFGEEAASLYFEHHAIDDTVRDNRRMFRDAMITAGFWSHPNEWWHFEYGTQSWALHSGEPHAIYGEIISP